GCGVIERVSRSRPSSRRPGARVSHARLNSTATAGSAPTWTSRRTPSRTPTTAVTTPRTPRAVPRAVGRTRRTESIGGSARRAAVRDAGSTGRDTGARDERGERLVHREAGEPCVGAGEEPVGEHGLGQLLHVVGQHVVAPGHGGARLGGAKQLDRGAR